MKKHKRVTILRDGRRVKVHHVWVYHIAPRRWNLLNRPTRICTHKHRGSQCEKVQQYDGEKWVDVKPRSAIAA